MKKYILITLTGIALLLGCSFAVSWWQFKGPWKKIGGAPYFIVMPDCSERSPDGYIDSIVIRQQAEQAKDDDFFAVKLKTDGSLQLFSKDGRNGIIDNSYFFLRKLDWLVIVTGNAGLKLYRSSNIQSQNFLELVAIVGKKSFGQTFLPIQPSDADYFKSVADVCEKKGYIKFRTELARSTLGRCYTSPFSFEENSIDSICKVSQ